MCRLLTGVTSLFQAELTTPDSCWRNPCINNAFETVLSIKDLLQNSIGSNPVNYDVILHVDDQLFDILKVRKFERTLHGHLVTMLYSYILSFGTTKSYVTFAAQLLQTDETSHYSQLCEVLQTSTTSLLAISRLGTSHTRDVIEASCDVTSIAGDHYFSFTVYHIMILKSVEGIG